MNRIIQYIPRFADVEPKSASFETVEELLSIDWVLGYGGSEPKAVFCKSEPSWDPEEPRKWCLMLSTKTWWWVIGYFDDGESLDLPLWDDIREKN